MSSNTDSDYYTDSNPPSPPNLWSHPDHLSLLPRKRKVDGVTKTQITLPKIFKRRTLLDEDLPILVVDEPAVADPTLLANGKRVEVGVPQVTCSPCLSHGLKCVPPDSNTKGKSCTACQKAKRACDYLQKKRTKQAARPSDNEHPKSASAPAPVSQIKLFSRWRLT